MVFCSRTVTIAVCLDLLQGTLEMKNEKIVRLLLEMLELDTSEYVRLMVGLSRSFIRIVFHRSLALVKRI